MKKFTFLKKITLFYFAILTQTTSAQTWNLIDNNGYGIFPNETFALEGFKGNFIAATGTGNNPGASIFVSPSGDVGTWVQQATFTAIVNPNSYGAKELATTTAAGGWIATGTKNFTSGPEVYNSPDGASWSNMGAIPYSNSLSNYYEVSSMVYFNPSGADDTLYVAVENGTDGAEIWKNYASGGTWTQVFDFPSFTTARINDMVKFNNKLYACTRDALIYESANGNNWTMNIPADTGFNYTGTYSFTAMTVFQNRLYVAAKNNITGTQIWNTSDGITWSSVNTDGFTNGSDMEEVTDLMVADGKLWISAYSWVPGGAILPDGDADRGASYFTYIYSYNGTTFTNSNNDAFGSTNRYGNLGFYQNFIYQGSDNSGWGNGELWRICTPPTPNIVSSASSICEYATVNFSDTLYSAVSYEWYVDSTLMSTSSTFSYNPSSLGVQSIKLIEINGTCIDSSLFTLTVNSIPVTFNTSYASYCFGETVQLYDTTSSGTAPYTYVWDDGTGTLDTTNTPAYNFPATTGASFTVTVTDVNGCSSGANYGYLANASTDLVGHVSYSGGNVTNGNAVAYKYFGTYTYFDTMQIASLNASGNYIFTALNSGDYLIKIFANKIAYPTLNSTYYGNKWAWDSAAVVVHDCSMVDSANVVMVEELGIGGGPGMLTGTITEDIGFGSLIALGGGIRTPGDPIPGLDVKLGKNPGGAMVATGITNGAGVYTFSSVPLNTGIEYYTVYVDIPGLGRDSSYNVTLTAANNQIYYLDYIVDSTTIYIVPNAGLGLSNPTVAEENKFGVYPNPTKGNATIEYNLLADATVTLSVYNVLGVKISEIVNSEQKLGAYKYSIHSDDAHLDAGVYFITLITDGKTSIQRLIITK